MPADEEIKDSDTWMQATDWDDPLEVAFLYKDTTIESGCGHAMEWNAPKVLDCNKCPVCQQPVALICDGGSTGHQHGPLSIAFFKYGKRMYRLSVARSTRKKASLSTKTTPADKNSSRSNSSLWESVRDAWSMIQNSTRDDTGPITAQDRIQYALGLVGLKILHKGKVLYPSKSTTEDLQSQNIELSKQLMEISNQDWQKSKPSLVVMGTLQGQELKGPPPKKSEPWTWQQIIYFPWNIVRFTWHCSWLFLRTFLHPFFPQHTITDDEGRPHQD